MIWSGMNKLWTFVHQTQHVVNPDTKYYTVDDYKNNQSQPHLFSGNRRQCILGTHDAVDYPRLTADFCGKPSRKHGNKSGRSHNQGKSMQCTGFIKATTGT